MPRGEVPVTPLREAFERSGLTQTEVARHLDWRRPSKRNCVDGERVQCALGMKGHQSRGKVYFRQRVDYETAVKIVRALGLDPVDFDL